MSEEFVKLFGDRLVNPSTGYSDVNPADSIAGKTLMLYFSAHWCPPCRRFTPMLIEFYNKLKAKGVDFELVFVSLDREERQWREYTSGMPWLCVPFDMPDSDKNLLATKYHAEGIPHLVVVDETGDVITEDGTSQVQIDSDGEKFPWTPPTFADVWPSEILSKSGTISSTDLKDKYLMLYFSAHWCPPCRAFTPVLSKAYTELKQQRDDFELVFVSSDRDQGGFDEYFGEMTFCAVPFEDRQAKNELAKRFKVQGIPKLIMLGPANEEGERELINDSIRGAIESGDFADFPFHPKPYGDLNNGGENINDRKCLIVFHENGDDDDQKDVVEAVKAAALQLKDKHDMDFLWALDPTGLTPRVRDALKMKNISDEATMIILDIPDQGGFYTTTETDVTVENIVKFIDNPGARQQIGR